MFAKIKAALASLAMWIAQRIKPMDLEAELAAGVADTEAALRDATGEAEKVVEKIESAIEPAKSETQAIERAKAVLAAPVIGQAGAAMAALAQGIVDAAPSTATISDIDATITKVKDLIVLADREVPASFDALADLAKSVASDANAWLIKMENLLDYGKAKPDVWAQIVGAVKVL